MKKLLLIITFSFCLLPFAFPQPAWHDISANIPGTPDLSDVYFVSDNEGWITSSSHAEIYHTTDGGETFEIQTTLYTCNAIHMLNENVGYAGGASGFIYKTTDGGEHWTHHGSISTTLADISFPPTGDTGYACGFNGNIWSITSTGIDKMISNVNGDLGSISFPINSEEGWVCGGSVLLHFFNNEWLGDQLRPAGGYNAICMVDTLNGWEVGDNGIIIHTSNGWEWFEQTNPDPQSRTFFDIFFLNTNEGWAVGIGGIILHTTNGGTTWLMEGTELTTESIAGVHFTSPANGYAVGRHKTLLKYGEISGMGDEIEPLKFDIYPNPAISVVNLQSPVFSQSATVALFGVDGRMLLEKTIPKGSEEITVDVRSLHSGVYFCRITVGNKSVTKKLVIK